MTEIRRLTWVWATLSAITIGAWWLGHATADPSVSAATTAALAALTIAAVKVALIVWHFMEVRSAPTWLRVATAGWLVLLVAAIAAIYLC